MPCYPPIGVPRIAITHFPLQGVVPPSVPGIGIYINPVAERIIINHMFFEWISVRSSSNTREAFFKGIKGSVLQMQWLKEILLQELIQRLACNSLDDITQQHKAQVAVVPCLANRPFQGKAGNIFVTLSRRIGMVVGRLPLV